MLAEPTATPWPARLKTETVQYLTITDRWGCDHEFGPFADEAAARAFAEGWARSFAQDFGEVVTLGWGTP